MVTDTDFKFQKHVPWDSPDMTPLKFSEKRAWPGTHDPNMVKDTLQLSQTRSLGQSGHDPLKNFQKGGVQRVTFPYIFGALNADCSNTVKVTNFKFDNRVPRDRKEGVARDVSPPRFWGLIAPTRLQIRTSNLTNTFPGTVRT